MYNISKQTQSTFQCRERTGGLQKYFHQKKKSLKLCNSTSAALLWVKERWKCLHGLQKLLTVLHLYWPVISEAHIPQQKSFWRELCLPPSLLNLKPTAVPNLFLFNPVLRILLRRDQGQQCTAKASGCKFWRPHLLKRFKNTITGDLVLNHLELPLILFVGICARPQSQDKKVFSGVQVEFHSF